MSSTAGNVQKRPHAIVIPCPAQGHIHPLLMLAKLLHQRGFFITFVNSEYNHRRHLRSHGPSSLDGLPDFRFETIPDGLPPSDADVAQDVAALVESTTINCLEPFCELITKLNNAAAPGGPPPVSCIVADGAMAFTLKAAERFGLPDALFWTTSAGGFLAYTYYKDLMEKGYIPLKDMSQVTDGYLETTIDWTKGLKNFRLRDFPAFFRTTDPNDFMLNFPINETNATKRADAVIFNTFDALEQEVLEVLSSSYPPIYTIGPLPLMMNHVQEKSLSSIKSSLWKVDFECINWLDKKEPESVLYVNFGSNAVITAQQLTEFAWGLANSKKPFLWVIRPDLVAGESAMLPPEFVMETKDRCLMSSWVPQEQVLKHPAIGGFLTHSGWNSTLESIAEGVPMICWPFFAEQQTNCRLSCVEWGVGMEIDNNVKKDEVESLVRELMDGEKGKRMKEKALDWKRKAEEATAPGGSSYLNLDKLINEVLNK
uniref:Glycosyltransferase n=1 Tax=Scoparia dulcis TaxID=107240 RepID=A0A5H2Q736_SCODU|nr:UDP-glycosyltransferase [Scoparia dulcis]